MVSYSKKEDFLNTLTHYVGLGILSLILIPLIYSFIKSGQTYKALTFTVYYLSQGLMFLASSLYHGAKDLGKRKALRVLDHCAIPICIGGTYTPIVLLGLEGRLSKVILGLVWVLALLAVIMDLYYSTRAKPLWAERLSIGTYLLMGWLSLFMVKPIVSQLGWGLFFFMLGGGLAYSLGVVFYRVKKIPYNHAIWHVFIIVANFSMLAGIIKYLA